MVNNGLLGGFVNSDRNQLSEFTHTLFKGALMGSATVKATPRDTWGNVKVPRIEAFESTLPTHVDPDGWYTVGEENMDTYSSIMGIPMAGINDSTLLDYKVRIESSYMYLNCSLGVKGSGSLYMPPDRSNSTICTRSGRADLFWYL